MTARVLIVDDDAMLRGPVRDRMEHWGHEVTEAADGQAALAAAAEQEFDLVLLDLTMPRMGGLETLEHLKSDGYGADVVVLTAHASVETAVEAMHRGAADFLQKPADFDLLRAKTESILERRRQKRMVRALKDRVAEDAPHVIGESPAMRELLEVGSRAARSDATVLITGESGSGKQVLAEYVHAQSERSKGPFVYVNCVALSDELVESTLFGHEKGAFTGAVAKKEGRLELAQGGTAFLDEIGDTTPRLQTKLLHFLETSEYERVGGTRTLTADCRIIAATNRDLEAAIKDGEFREDLYYRLNVIHLTLPPLRERREDVPALTEAFVERFAGELRRGPVSVAPETMERLQAYSWPGNVRQLKNLIERMVVLAPEEKLTPELLPPELSHPSTQGEIEIGTMAFKDAVLLFKREYIKRALKETGGNQTKAADLLKMQRTHLNRLIRELGIRDDEEDQA